MPLTLDPEQRLLKDNAREFIRDAAPVGHLRRLRDTQPAAGFSRELWQQMVELGWSGIIIPERYGGSGLGYTELGVVLEECGATLAPQPLLSSVLLSAGVLLDAGSDAQKRAWLPEIAAGRALLSLAFEETPRFAPYTVACRAEASGAGYRLNGHKTFVLDGHAAQHLIVSARTAGATNEREGISLFIVDARAPGVELQRSALLDARSAAKLRLESVEVGADSVVGRIGGGADVLERTLDRATIGLAAEMLGMLQQAYETTLEYLKTRVQFDVLIGSFQALQHRAVDLFCELELARSVVMDALSAIDEGRDDISLMASASKARLCEVSRRVTREAVQLHGGIGMTDEHDIGLYLKRGAVAEACLGDAAYHRERFATLKGF